MNNKKSWLCDFSDSEHPYLGTPEIKSNMHNYTECDEVRTKPHLGYSRLFIGTKALTNDRCHVSGIEKSLPATCGPDQKTVVRTYPTWDGRYNFPVLVMHWLRLEAPDYPQARFSQFTTKGRYPKQGEIITGHILGDGSYDLGHSDMYFQSKTVKLPLNKWTLQSLVIWDDNGKTQAEFYQNTDLAVGAYCEKPWTEKQLRHWHMGSYYNVEQFPTVEFAFFNNRIQIIELDHEEDALDLIGKEYEEFSEKPPQPDMPVTITLTVDGAVRTFYLIKQGDMLIDDPNPFDHDDLPF